ncbi:MAG: ATP-dependent RecD-like DNA helicase [Clostridiales bacterium]|nr:ATP-dependent RecD-like DNA helicase [Clostridiales bacterium]
MNGEFVSLDAEVLQVIYRNEENGYSVIELAADNRIVTAVGVCVPLASGEIVHIEGSWTFHREYGQQIRMALCRPIPPAGSHQMEVFLASGIVKGCGPNFARAIVDTFGEDTHDVLLGDPAKLTCIPKIGMATAIKITESYKENMSIRQNVSALMELGLTVNQAMRISAHYGENAITVVRQNPYRLAEDVAGIGFRIADAIAMKVGIERASQFRIDAALRYCLVWAGEEGHTYLPAKVLVDTTTRMIGVEQDAILKRLAAMCSSRSLILGPGEEEPVYLPYFSQAEQECASRLFHLANARHSPIKTPLSLKTLERLHGVKLAEEQKNAVETALKSAVTIITGGPGTGKTTIVRFLLELMESAGMECVLCAPTGRAAKRMGEATGMDAYTIHRLLEYSGGDDSPRFQKDENDPLDQDVIIVDETSMVDVFLFMRLLRAIRPESRLILIGDADQLPSVGPGNILRDLIHSNCIPTVKLITVYRQGEGSGISLAAHRVNRGEMPMDGAGGDFIFLEQDSIRGCWQKIEELLKEDGSIQVIAPSKKGDLGVIALNQRLQQLLNPPHPKKPQLELGGKIYRQGDRVMQIKNDYKIPWERDEGTMVTRGEGIFNGEMGVLAMLEPAVQQATILFDDDRLAIYPTYDLAEMDTCYAISIHKSQGSEFQKVIIPILATNPLLCTRNLLYTAITRAKKQVYLIGPRKAVQFMVQNDRMQTKYSGFATALEEVFS